MPDTTETRLAVLENRTNELQVRVKELNSLHVRLNVAILIAAMLGLTAGGLLYKIWRVWPYIPTGQMDVALESERHPGFHLHVGTNREVTVERNQLSSPFVRWTLKRIPPR